MTVHWYAANEGFHPIPAGYGLPWGTKNEKYIPQRITREAEFELARSQLATQAPVAAVMAPEEELKDLAPVSGQIVLSPTTRQFGVGVEENTPLEGEVVAGQFHEARALSHADLPWR